MTEFKPPFGLGSPHTQSLLNSSGIRKRMVSKHTGDLLKAQQEWIMDAGDGIRLLAHYSPQPRDSRGLAVLFHGWEGSSNSNYVMANGARLFAEGFDVFRLNFRDHGGTYSLNPGIFHSCRIDEVINALADMQRRTGARNWQVAGFSLGGNFALRVARHGPDRGLSVGQVFAVCPVLNPLHALEAMEQGPAFYEKYYVRKWARSMREKQRCFPERYNYDEWFSLPGMRKRTEYFALRHYDFPSVEAYFEGYSVAGNKLDGLQVPGVLMTSEDDPVIPVKDIDTLVDLPTLDIRVTRYGGHCGYLKNWKLDSWAEDQIAEQFLKLSDAG